MTDELPQAVKALLREHVTSFEKLELVLLFGLAIADPSLETRHHVSSS
jgi:hypothetical protein